MFCYLSPFFYVNSKCICTKKGGTRRTGEKDESVNAIASGPLLYIRTCKRLVGDTFACIIGPLDGKLLVDGYITN